MSYSFPLRRYRLEVVFRSLLGSNPICHFLGTIDLGEVAKLLSASVDLSVNVELLLPTS